MSTAWVLVSDAARGRLFETTDGALVEVACYNNSDLRGLPKQGGSGRTTPRTQDSAGPGRHVIEPHTTRRDKSTHAFAHQIVADMREAHEHHRYDELYLVAPPHFLGVLREQLGNWYESGVAGELGNDLVELPTGELMQRLHEAFPATFPGKPVRAGL